MMRFWAQAFLLVLLYAAGAACADVAVPSLVARVNDLTATLDSTQKQELESRLAQFEAKKGAQIAVLIVPTTEPETIEQYGLRVAEAWKLGRTGVDDGALLLVAKDDRTLRIEVGYGLEGALNDATAKRIIAEFIVPDFKRGDLYGGIMTGVTRMMAVIEGEPLPPPRARSAASGGFKDYESLLFVGFMLVMVVGGALRAMLGRLPAAAIIGFVAGLLAWLIVAPLLVAGIIGIIAFIFTLAGGGHGMGGGRGYGGGLGGGGASGRW